MDQETMHLLSYELPLLFGAIYIITRAVAFMYNNEKVPLKELGVDDVQRVLAFELPEYRSDVWRRGWMTRKEWRNLLEKQNDLLSKKISEKLNQSSIE